MDFSADGVVLIQSISADSLIPFMRFLSDFTGDTPGYILILLFFYFCIDRAAGIRLFLYMTFSDALNRLLKTVFMQQRPFQTDKRIKIYFNPETKHLDYGMPSGHAQSSTVVYGTFFHSAKSHAVRMFLLILIFLIAFSRLYLGVHSVLQVLSGLLTGILCLIFLIKSENFILSRVLKFKPAVFISAAASSGLLYLAVTIMVYHLRTGFVEFNFLNVKNAARAAGLFPGICIGGYLLNMRYGISLPESRQIRFLSYLSAVFMVFFFIYLIEKPLLSHSSGFYFPIALAFAVRFSAGIFIFYFIPAVFKAAELRQSGIKTSDIQKK